MHKQNQSVTDRGAEGVQLGQRAAIYVRVSTTDQSCQRQIAELTAFAGRSGFEVLGIFKETASGTRNNRLARNRVLQLAQARRIDAVLVTELSRWGRSTQDLLDTLYKLAGWKVSLVAMNGMTFELHTPHGRMMATMLRTAQRPTRSSPRGGRLPPFQPLICVTEPIQVSWRLIVAVSETGIRSGAGYRVSVQTLSHQVHS